jgi:hypothetical protein
MIVTIPTREDHEGLPCYLGTYKIADTCPVCGGTRGEPFKAFSYDGSRRLPVDGWTNKCGHVDKYSVIRKEGELI